MKNIKAAKDINVENSDLKAVLEEKKKEKLNFNKKAIVFKTESSLLKKNFLALTQQKRIWQVLNIWNLKIDT